ncbi:hypothetical protein B0H17DRAFT_1112644 [Mycena rosella]|uniref:Uncharacterized protein n=1 Tax=Mycena rosella TaxID=1033263 RepID=A0AAD7BIE0_MYCRO|nr:hypothetical protein B0H17DRAFT_1112644 [Mycena rosella]
MAPSFSAAALKASSFTSHLPFPLSAFQFPRVCHSRTSVTLHRRRCRRPACSKAKATLDWFDNPASLLCLQCRMYQHTNCMFPGRPWALVSQPHTHSCRASIPSQYLFVHVYATESLLNAVPFMPKAGASTRSPLLPRQRRQDHPRPHRCQIT